MRHIDSLVAWVIPGFDLLYNDFHLHGGTPYLTTTEMGFGCVSSLTFCGALFQRESILFPRINPEINLNS